MDYKQQIENRMKECGSKNGQNLAIFGPKKWPQNRGKIGENHGFHLFWGHFSAVSHTDLARNLPVYTIQMVSFRSQTLLNAFYDVCCPK